MASNSWHPFAQTTPGGYNFGQCVSALQKEIRRSNEWNAMFWAMEIAATKGSGRQNNAKYLWKRLGVIASEDIGPADMHLPVLISTLRASWDEHGGEAGLFLAHAIVAMCRAPKSRHIVNLVISEYQGDHRLDVPDYALDRHTLEGKRRGRGWDQFFEEAAKLIDPDPEAIARLEAQCEADCERLTKAGSVDRYKRAAELPLGYEQE